MPTELNTSDLRPLLRRADRAAAGLCRRHRLPWFDVEDARQDLLLDLLGRLHNHDPNRGFLGSFVAICFHHRRQRLDAVLHREQHERHFTSIDDVLPGAERLTVADTLTTEDGIGFWLGQHADPVAQSDLRHDLNLVLGRLDSDVVVFCSTLLQHGSDRLDGRSRATHHRRVRDLRCQLLAAGIGPRETSLRTRGY